ncbi:MAG: hypothetical protein WBN76_00250, partial [Azonexus sp.]
QAAPGDRCAARILVSHGAVFQTAQRPSSSVALGSRRFIEFGMAVNLAQFFRPGAPAFVSFRLGAALGSAVRR